MINTYRHRTDAKQHRVREGSKAHTGADACMLDEAGAKPIHET